MRTRSLINLLAALVWLVSQPVMGYAQHASGSGSSATGLLSQTVQIVPAGDGLASAGRGSGSMSVAEAASYRMRNVDRPQSDKPAYHESGQCEMACQGVTPIAAISLVHPRPLVERYRLVDDTGIAHQCSLPTPPPDHAA